METRWPQKATLGHAREPSRPVSSVKRGRISQIRKLSPRSVLDLAPCVYTKTSRERPSEWQISLSFVLHNPAATLPGPSTMDDGVTDLPEGHTESALRTQRSIQEASVATLVQLAGEGCGKA